MKLNGWQRIGVVLSALWVLIALYFISFEVPADEVTVWRLLAALFLPILAFWAIAYAALFAFLWIRKGFFSDRKSASSGDYDSVPAQLQIVAPSSADSSRSQPRHLEPAPQPQKRFEIKGFITRAWNGEEHLWIVFWVYMILGSLLFTFLFAFVFSFLAAINIPMGWNIVRATHLILLLVLLLLLVAYVVWALASLWKCAFNVGVEWKWLGYLARAYVVWGVCVFIYRAWIIWSR
jgi:hypothetical protein